MGVIKRLIGSTRVTLGPPVVPFCPFLGEASPTKTDYSKKGALILSSLLEDLALIMDRDSMRIPDQHESGSTKTSAGAVKSANMTQAEAD